MKPLLLITKNQQDGELLKQKLEDIPLSIASSPLMEIKPISYQLPSQRYDYYIFISKNSIRCSLKFIHTHHHNLEQAEILCIGRSTEQYLKKLTKLNAFSPEIPKSEHLLSSDALSRPLNKKILIIRGKGGLNLLKKQLTLKGARVDYLEVYERIKNPKIFPQILNLLKSYKPLIIILSSIFETEQFMQILSSISDPPMISVIFPSERIAHTANLSYFQNIFIINPTNTDKIKEMISFTLGCSYG